MEILKNIVFVCLFIKIIDTVAVRMVRAWKYMKLRKKHHKRMEEIKEWAEAHNISVYEAVYELLFLYYETAGFWSEVLDEELYSKTEAELIELYCQI